MSGFLDDFKGLFKGNHLGKNATVNQDEINDGKKQFFQGSTVEQDGYINGTQNANIYQEYRNYEAEGKLQYSRVENEPIKITSPDNIHEIRLSEREIDNPERFWGQHSKTKEDYLKIAGDIPTIQARLADGEKLEDLYNDSDVGSCAWLYFSPNRAVKVYDYKGTYMIDSDGRHRIMAAREMKVDIPVRVIGRYQPIAEEKKENLNEAATTERENRPLWELSPEERAKVNATQERIAKEWREKHPDAEIPSAIAEKAENRPSWELTQEQKKAYQEKDADIIAKWRQEHGLDGHGNPITPQERPKGGIERERGNEDPRRSKESKLRTNEHQKVKEQPDGIVNPQKDTTQAKQIQKNPFAYQWDVSTQKDVETNSSKEPFRESTAVEYTTPETKILRRDATEQWKIGLNAIDANMEMRRDDMRDKGMSDGPEMERIIAKERKSAMEELRTDIDAQYTKTKESADRFVPSSKLQTREIDQDGIAKDYYFAGNADKNVRYGDGGANQYFIAGANEMKADGRLTEVNRIVGKEGTTIEHGGVDVRELSEKEKKEYNQVAETIPEFSTSKDIENYVAKQAEKQDSYGKHGEPLEYSEADLQQLENETRDERGLNKVDDLKEHADNPFTDQEESAPEKNDPQHVKWDNARFDPDVWSDPHGLKDGDTFYQLSVDGSTPSSYFTDKETVDSCRDKSGNIDFQQLREKLQLSEAGGKITLVEWIYHDNIPSGDEVASPEDETNEEAVEPTEDESKDETDEKEVEIPEDKAENETDEEEVESQKDETEDGTDEEVEDLPEDETNEEAVDLPEDETNEEAVEPPKNESGDETGKEEMESPEDESKDETGEEEVESLEDESEDGSDEEAVEPPKNESGDETGKEEMESPEDESKDETEEVESETSDDISNEEVSDGLDDISDEDFSDGLDDISDEDFSDGLDDISDEDFSDGLDDISDEDFSDGLNDISDKDFLHGLDDISNENFSDNLDSADVSDSIDVMPTEGFSNDCDTLHIGGGIDTSDFSSDIGGDVGGDIGGGVM